MLRNSKRRLFDQPQSVIQRFVRLKASAYADGVGKRIVRPLIRFRERETNRARAQAFAAVLGYAERSQKEKLPDSYVVANATLYFMMAERDLMVSKIDALSHHDVWVRKFHIRVIMMTVCEWKIATVFDHEFFTCLARIGISSEKVNIFKGACKTFNKTKGKVETKFQWLRNNAIAHRNADALNVYKQIRQVDERQSVELLVELFDGVREIVNLLTEFVKASGSPRAILKQLSDKM